MTTADLTELESILSDMESDHNADDYPCPGIGNCSLARAIFNMTKLIVKHRIAEIESGFDDPTQEAKIEMPIMKDPDEPDFPKPGVRRLPPSDSRNANGEATYAAPVDKFPPQRIAR